jgi:hypothetical protein
MEQGAARLLRLLRELGDPAAEDVDSALRPGRARRELTHRLLDLWESGGASTAAPTRGEATASLVRRAAAAGACSSEAAAAVEGTASPSESLAVPLVLAELALVVRRQQLQQSASSSASSSAEGGPSGRASDATLVQLIAQEDLDDVFSPRCSLLPPDMASAIRLAASERDDAALTAEALEADVAELRHKVAAAAAAMSSDDAGGSGSTKETDGASGALPVRQAASEHHLRTAAVFLDTVAQQVDDVVRLCEARLSGPLKSMSFTPLASTDAVARRQPIKASVAEAAASLTELNDIIASVARVAAEIEAIEARRAPPPRHPHR